MLGWCSIAWCPSILTSSKESTKFKWKSVSVISWESETLWKLWVKTYQVYQTHKTQHGGIGVNMTTAGNYFADVYQCFDVHQGTGVMPPMIGWVFVQPAIIPRLGFKSHASIHAKFSPKIQDFPSTDLGYSMKPHETGRNWGNPRNICDTHTNSVAPVQPVTWSPMRCSSQAGNLMHVPSIIAVLAKRVF